MNYEQDKTIDRTDLIGEWLQQSELAADYGRSEAEQQKVVDDLKAALDQQNSEVKRIKSEIWLKVAQDPESFGLTKATQDAINSCVLVHQSVTDAQEKYYDLQEKLNEAEYELNDRHAMTKAITTDRRQALENLVQLELNGWNGEPKSGEYSGYMYNIQQQKQQASQGMAEQAKRSG